MRLVRLCAAAVLVAGMTAAVAQPPGGGRGQGGGFGFGGGGGGPTTLLTSKTVQGELKLSDEQTTKLKDWSKSFADKAKSIREEKLQGLEGPERFQKMGEVNAAVSKAAYAELANVLKDDQIKRLKQIEVQMAAAQAFAMPDVQTALKLTDEQKDKLKDAQDKMRGEMMELFQEAGFQPGQPPDRAKMADLQKKQAGLSKEFMTKVEGMLTADQKTAWKGLTGEKVDLEKIRADMPQFTPKKKKDD